MATEHLLTDSDVAYMFRVSTRRVHRLVRDNGLPHVILPDGEIRFIDRDIMAWVESLRQPAPIPPVEPEVQPT